MNDQVKDQKNETDDRREELLQHAESKWDRGDFHEAVRVYNKILELDPNDVWSYWERALIKRRKGDWEGALKDLNRLLEIDSTHSFAYYQRALIKEHFKDRKGAELDFGAAASYREKEMKIMREEQSHKLQMSMKKHRPDSE
jgi:tetratricopeptide (TPR) repeat protein